MLDRLANLRVIGPLVSVLVDLVSLAWHFVTGKSTGENTEGDSK